MFIQVNDCLINIDYVSQIDKFKDTYKGFGIQFKQTDACCYRFQDVLYENEQERDAMFNKLADMLGNKVQNIPISFTELTEL